MVSTPSTRPPPQDNPLQQFPRPKHCSVRPPRTLPLPSETIYHENLASVGGGKGNGRLLVCVGGVRQPPFRLQNNITRYGAAQVNGVHRCNAGYFSCLRNDCYDVDIDIDFDVIIDS